jgi:predicted metal-dependent phosphoesterase TrpH
MHATGEIDLHCHSTASDGTLRPAEVVRLAHRNGLSGLALTDHDTIAGVAEAAREAASLGIDFLPGIEVSCAFPRPGTFHLLGYGTDLKSPALRKLVRTLEAAREERAALIVRRLNALGIDVTLKEAQAEAGEMATIGRPHLAVLLVRKGHAVSTRDAFTRYLGGGGAAYVDTAPLLPEQAIALIREAGGMASLGHPFQLRRREFSQLEALVRELADQGMEGIETLHGSHDPEQVHRLTRLADRHNLLTTGGSDFHGANKPWIRLGEAGERRVIPRRFFDAVTERLKGRRAMRKAG